MTMRDKLLLKLQDQYAEPLTWDEKQVLMNALRGGGGQSSGADVSRPIDLELRKVEIMGLRYWLHAVRTNMIRDSQDGVKLIQAEVEEELRQSNSDSGGSRA